MIFIEEAPVTLPGFNNDNDNNMIIIIIIIMLMVMVMIGNSNWTEWSTIQGVIVQVISKLEKREANLKL